MQPDRDIAGRVSRLLGHEVATWHPVRRGYTPAQRWVVRCFGGTSAFVKVSTNSDTNSWLRAEHEVYSRTRESFLPHLLGWDEGEPSILALEDLSDAVWPPPWSQERVWQVLQALEQVAALAMPRDRLPSLEGMREQLCGWQSVARDPGPFLGLGLCEPEWLDQALPALRQAESAAVLAGNGFLHLDIRSDNLCFANERTVFVDWNHSCVGNPLFDVAFWLPSLALEGGPRPEEILPGQPELAVVVAGFFAVRAGLPSPIGASPLIRKLQRDQLAVALPWAARGLGLKPPGFPATFAPVGP